MKTKEKILETLLKIQELVESIADNQHRPNAVFYKPYSLPIPNWNNDNEEQKPFPEYWWTYTEGLPDIIKDWISSIQEHKFDFDDWLIITKASYKNLIVGINAKAGHYVTHQQIIDHYGLEEKPGVNLMDYTYREEVKIEPDEQPKKLYTKEEILNAWDDFWKDVEYASFPRWVEQNM